MRGSTCTQDTRKRLHPARNATLNRAALHWAEMGLLQMVSLGVSCAAVRIFFVTSEIAPFSEVSDLAALSAALPKALRGLDHHVTVVTPLYGSIDSTAHALARRLSTLPANIDGETVECALYDGRTTGGVDVHFIGHERFGDGPIADAGTDDTGTDTVARAVLLGQAAAALIGDADPACDIVHAVGAQAGLALMFARAARPGVGTVLSGVDLGRDQALAADALAMLQSAATAANKTTDAQPAPTSLIAAAVGAADRVIVASPRQALALAAGDASPAGKLVADRKDAVVGILEGVDAAVWNPLVDPHLTARFDPADVAGKQQCKGSLQYEAGLPVRPETPLMVALASDLGGMDKRDANALAGTIEALARNEMQLVIAHDGELPRPLQALCGDDGEQVRALNTQGDPAAMHRLFGGADLVWIAGSTTPQGTLHLAAQRYGAIPIVAGDGVTGETVVDCDNGLETGTGFVFDRTGSDAPAAELSALQRALAAFANSDAFAALQRRSMRTDSSWERAARRYEHVYRSLETS